MLYFKYLFFVVLIQFCVNSSYSADLDVSTNIAKSTNDSMGPKFFEQYNKKNYEEALVVLDSYKNTRDSFTLWYYFAGLAYARLEKHDEAIEAFEAYVKKNETTGSASKAYYFLGLMHFYKGSYEAAINSFQIASDLSTDNNLDRVLDIQLEKAIRYRDYYDSHKATNLSLFVGYNYTSNAIGFSQSLSSESLAGNVLTYGAGFSHRVIDKFNFVFEPTLTILDKYTTDKSFKSVSTVQAVDALQAQLSLPIAFFFGKESGTQYSISLNASSTYLPIVSTKRELYMNSYFLKTKVSSDLSKLMSIDTTILLSADQAGVYSTEDSNSTGSRGELSFNLIHYIDRNRTKSMQYGLSGIFKDAKGIDMKYQKYQVDVSYGFLSFAETSSLISLDFIALTFPEKAAPRKDNQGALTYTLAQSLNSKSGMNYYLTYLQNSSNIESYVYNEYKLGLNYFINLSY